MEREEDKLSGYKVSLFLLFYGGWGLKWFSCGLSRLEHAMYLGCFRIPDTPVSTAQALRSQVCATMLQAGFEASRTLLLQSPKWSGSRKVPRRYI